MHGYSNFVGGRFRFKLTSDCVDTYPSAEWENYQGVTTQAEIRYMVYLQEEWTIVTRWCRYRGEDV